MDTTTAHWLNTSDSRSTNGTDTLHTFGRLDPGLFIDAFVLYKAYTYYYIIIDALLLIPTICGNLLILLALWRFQSLRTCNFYILIGNLAVSDLLVGIILIPFDMVIMSSHKLASEPLICMLHFCLITTLMGASVINLSIMSLERFHAIVRPLQHKNVFTRKRVYILMSVTWVMNVAIGFLPFKNWTRMTGSRPLSCRYDFITTAVYELILDILFFALFVTDLVFFVIIVRIALSKVHSSKTNPTPCGKATALCRALKRTKLMLFVSGLFFICWGPYFIMTFVPDSSPYVLFVRSWLYSLGFINSCLNWIVYGVRNRKFRAAFKRLLRCSFTNGEISISSSS